MIKLETMTDLEALRILDRAVLEKWVTELDRSTNGPAGKSPVSNHWKAQYKKQMQEIGGKILLLEQTGREYLAD